MPSFTYTHIQHTRIDPQRGQLREGCWSVQRRATGRGNRISKYNRGLCIWALFSVLQRMPVMPVPVHGKLWFLKVALPQDRIIWASGLGRAPYGWGNQSSAELWLITWQESKTQHSQIWVPGWPHYKQKLGTWPYPSQAAPIPDQPGVELCLYFSVTEHTSQDPYSTWVAVFSWLVSPQTRLIASRHW